MSVLPTREQPPCSQSLPRMASSEFSQLVLLAPAMCTAWPQIGVRSPAAEIPVHISCFTKWSHFGLNITRYKSSKFAAVCGIKCGNFTARKWIFHPFVTLSKSSCPPLISTFCWFIMKSYSAWCLLLRVPLTHEPGTASAINELGYVLCNISRAHSWNNAPLLAGFRFDKGCPLNELAVAPTSAHKCLNCEPLRVTKPERAKHRVFHWGYASTEPLRNKASMLLFRHEAICKDHQL